MSLTLEIYANKKGWIEAGNLNPGDRPGSISNNNLDGSRDVYLFECEVGNNKSVIYRSSAGIDTEIENLRVTNIQDLEIVKELSKDNPTLEMKVKTDRSQIYRTIRFTHR
ncbi:MAG: hypothetical protein Q8Q42_00850 [Nanoarchaeota archaeon]|nr:hypothetical protein [Nanoarchaeota archaeon]